MIRILSLILPVLLMINFTGCGSDDFIKPNENSPEAMFREIIADPIPEDVTNLKGASLYWQGYEVYFRFNATDAFIEKLLENHEQVPYKSIKKNLEKSKSLRDYLGFWTVDQVKEPECYKSKESYKNKVTHSGEDWILIDRVNKVVYCHGVGS